MRASVGRWGITLALSGLAGVVMVPGVVRSAPLAQIVSPQAGMKLRGREAVPIDVIVNGSSSELEWALSLKSKESTLTLARGTTAVKGKVAEITPEALDPGSVFELQLVVREGISQSLATSSVMVPDAHYRVIPLRSGEASERAYATYAVDGSGRQVLYSAKKGSPAPLTIVRRGSSERQTLLVDLSSTSGVKFSGDGSRVFLKGRFTKPGATGLGYVYTDTGVGLLLSPNAPAQFDVDESGHHVAYQFTGGGESGSTLQHFVLDVSTGARQQITSDPDTIDPGADCPSRSGSVPLITADGATVVFLTSATLGLVPEDPAVGCRVFSYNADTQQLRHVVDLPSNWLKAINPSLTDDGRWLSFPVSEVLASGGSRGIPVLVDVSTGEVTAPVLDTGGFTSFDSVITGDGTAIIISSQADLDPRVGNADHNMELFRIDRVTGDIEQITETLGGIGSTPGGCSTYDLTVNRDGTVLAFSTPAIDTSGCRLDGPQLGEENGMWLGMVRTVRKRPGNHEVVLRPIEDKPIIVGESAEITFRATDDDGDPISFYAQVPGTLQIDHGTFEDHYDGTATFTWQPRLEDVGTFTLRVAAFDEGGGEMGQDVKITVIADADDVPPCVGACTEPNSVGVDDVVTLVGIALGLGVSEQCPAGDPDANGQITVEEIQIALGNALAGCSSDD